ncbi:L-threonine 3-dehydrogenase, putative [Trypanosoma equiperdum]|uniref:L-threonine 3-dehydrogenase, mitochondrial n=2 Tax=Trypanozoon TaxID=39700 RepID=Q583Q5_TRYB2|nr:L-threonine 3-dehydrogenase, putative [Trypanosoma brucei brucei TREU927]AAX80982.1 L-threonine 3-dehydrogenase, putative [Trypanosoma brucei]AAZ11841.1 L-threonine 3-dehydrogenase, putative [Trypanosoma brucei brucei TREU927]SCU67686.1 L-threonine 3-dehydrogenase, putative [Trypanosoma equiperdum]
MFCFSRFALCAAAPRVLVTGALGQIGTDLSLALRDKFGADSVLVSDVVEPGAKHPLAGLKGVEKLDCLDSNGFEKLVKEFKPTWMYHLPAIMSVRGEAEPDLAMDINVNTTRYALELARKYNIRIFIPSTIAAFGDKCGKTMTKDDTIMNPSTVYGVTKVYTELLGTWYRQKYGVDFRSVRLPGIISAATLPGGGATDYAIHMYHSALLQKKCVCPVLPYESLPMMYMPDTLNSLVKIMEAPLEKLTRTVYNITGFSFSPSELRFSIERCTDRTIEVEYVEGPAQKIANSWPDSLDDSNARNDWGHQVKYDIDMMSEDMLRQIPILHGLPSL